MGMSEHSKEPWMVIENDAPEYGDPEACPLGIQANDFQIATLMGDVSDINAESNARRIVACVNACAGIPSEQLEKDIAIGGEKAVIESMEATISHHELEITRLGVALEIAHEAIRAGIMRRDKMLTAAKNLRDVKGRHNSEIAMKRLIDAINEIEAEQ